MTNIYLLENVALKRTLKYKTAVLYPSNKAFIDLKNVFPKTRTRYTPNINRQNEGGHLRFGDGELVYLKAYISNSYQI